MHAGWNLLARRERAETVFFHRMLLAVAVGGLVPALWAQIAFGGFSSAVWTCLAASTFFNAVYMFGLGRAYGCSDFTVVYPVARALPVLLVGLGDVLRGALLTPAGWGGMVLVVAGCILCPLHSFRELSWRRYVNRAMIFILLTAAGSVGHTLLDKIASDDVTKGPVAAAVYCYWFMALTFVYYTVLLRLFGRGGSSGSKVGWRMPVLGGLFCGGAYALVLWAYQLTPRAGYIVAFRQFSIVIGVVVAFILYRERGKGVRITGALLITAGLVVIGLWGAS